MSNAEDPQPSAIEPEPAAPGGFKQRRSRGNIRKRAVDASDDEQDATQIVRKGKHLKGDPLAFSTKKDAKEEVNLTFESNKALQSSASNDATRHLQTETEFDRDARCVGVDVSKHACLMMCQRGTSVPFRLRNL